MPYKSKKAHNEHSRNYYARVGRTPEQHRRYTLKSRYNITPEQWDEMFERQGGKCAICGRHQSECEKTFVVDHNHNCCPSRNSGKCCGKCIRGLLCVECNLMIGYAHDRKDILERAMDYLE
jgi:hypothetical protein